MKNEGLRKEKEKYGEGAKQKKQGNKGGKG